MWKSSSKCRTHRLWQYQACSVAVSLLSKGQAELGISIFIIIIDELYIHNTQGAVADTVERMPHVQEIRSLGPN